MTLWIHLEIASVDEPIRYGDFVRAVGDVERLRLARNPVKGRNPLTGAPIDIPLAEPTTLAEYLDDEGNWCHALQFLPLANHSAVVDKTDGRVVGTDRLFRLEANSPVVQALARALGAVAREVSSTG